MRENSLNDFKIQTKIIIFIKQMHLVFIILILLNNVAFVKIFIQLNKYLYIFYLFIKKISKYRFSC